MVDSPPEEKILHGSPVSRGIAIGPISVSARGFSAPDVYPISKEAIPNELNRLKAAMDNARLQLITLKDRIEQVSSGDEALVFEAHEMVLDDPSLQRKVKTAIETRLQNAEFCFYAVMQTFLEAMRRVPDPYLRERTIDIEDVCQRVLSSFTTNRKITVPDHQHLMVCHDLTPSETVTMDRSKLLGFVTEVGSVNSHTAILARALGIPAIVGINNIVLEATTLTPAILDGYSGKLILYPTPKTTEHYRELAARKKEALANLDKLRDLESTTLDGRHITLSANIEFNHELDAAQENRAEGVGLFRTEFLLSDCGSIPSEEEQTASYIELAQRSKPHLAIIRTLDSGGDKLSCEVLSEPEPNPFLGWRGIRVSLDRPDFFKEQLRAILKASAHGKVGMMFPFISGIGEVRQCRKYVTECMEELEQAGIPFDPKIQIGAMIEIPSAALIAEEMASEVDFFSIGTNDLIQYTLAVDRINNRVAKLYSSAHPSIMKLIKMTTSAASKAGIWTGLCGELAADLSLTPLTLGLGVDELSVGTREIALVRKALLSLDYSKCQELAEKALGLSTSEEVYQLSRKMAEEAYGDLLQGEDQYTANT